MIILKLRQAGERANHKRVERLYTEARLRADYGKGENMSTDKSTKYPLEQVSAKTAILLLNSEYLAERHDITSPESYLRLSVSASWDPIYESAIVKVVFEATAEQAVSMKSDIEDVDILDDIDSGIGEAFEAAFSEVYPDADGVGIGGTSAKVKIVKK